MALKEIKEASEKAINNYLQSGFGESYKVETTGGYPVITVLLTTETEKETTKGRVAYNLDNDDYQVSTFGERNIEKDGKEKLVAGWATIDSRTIEFIKDGIQKVMEAFFSPPKEKDNKEPELGPDPESETETETKNK